MQGSEGKRSSSNMLMKSFFGRIAKDFRQKELLPLKLIFFTQMSTLFILYPYLTIHMRELGINVEETAVMSGIIPFVAIIMPPIAGLIADRIGNFKVLLSLFSMLGGVAALLLLLVPVGRLTVSLPSRAVLELGCGGDGLELGLYRDYPCDQIPEARLDLALESCGYACPMSGQNETGIQETLMARGYQLHVYDPRSGRNESYSYRISESDMPKKSKIPKDPREDKILKNLEFYKIAIRRLSKNVLFFPAHKPQLFEFECSDGTDNATDCKFQDLTDQDVQAPGRASTRINASVQRVKSSRHDAEEEQMRYLARSVSWRAAADEKSARCTDSQQEVSLTLELSEEASVRADRCQRRCLATAPRKSLCTNSQMLVEFDVRLTFWSYLCIRVFIGMIGGTAFAMFEGAVIAVLREHKADYGLQRIYGSIGGIISSPLSGFLIDYASRNKSYTDFRPAFYLYAVLKIFSGFLMLLINLEFKTPATDVVHDVLSVLRNIEVVALLTACFINGTAWGYIESFLFWLLEDLGASRGLMGMTITVGGMAGIPLLVLSGPIIDKLGHANVLFMGFIFYAIRLMGYSVIQEPWQCLIFEALESVTSSLSFTAAVTYAAKLSTTSTDSSIQGLLGGIYYGVGKGCGSLIGGFLMKGFGTRPTYRIFGVVTLLTGFIYLAFNLCYLSKRPPSEGNDIVKKKPKPPAWQAENGPAGQQQQQQQQQPTSNEQKALEAVAREPYVVDDIEAINNARNLDIVESVVAEHAEEATTLPRQRHQANGNVNPAFSPDHEPACQVTVEHQPKKANE